MKALEIIVGIIGVCVVAPIWYYLLYKILLAVNTTELMWFLFWVYLPAAFLSVIIRVVVESQKKKP